MGQQHQLLAQVVEDAVKDYFTKKKSRLSAALMKSLLKERPSRQAAEALMGHYSTARNAFLKAEAVQLLQTLMHPNKVSMALTLLKVHCHIATLGWSLALQGVHGSNCSS